jgi:hypothetical protein
VKVAVDTSVFVGVTVTVPVAVSTDVCVDVGVAVKVPHGPVPTVFVSSVTWPFLASSLPSTVAEFNSVIEVNAMIVPEKALDAPSVAELPTTQNTFFACAPLESVIMLFVAVIRVVDALKMNTALLSPLPLRIRVPVSPKVPESYTPGIRVDPPSSVPGFAVVARPDASL